MDFKEAARRLQHDAPRHLESWLPGGKLKGKEFEAGSLRGEPGASLKVNVNTGLWSDFATGEKGCDLLSLYAQIKGINNYAAMQELFPEEFKRPDPPPKDSFPPMAQGWDENYHWIYRHPDGTVAFYVFRVGDGPSKNVFPYSFVNGKWQAKGYQGIMPLLNSHKIKRSSNIIVVEGEKALSAAEKLCPDYVIVTWHGGTSRVSDSDFGPLFGHDVILWPDNDEPGIKAMAEIADKLKGRCKRIRTLDVSGLPPKGDAVQATEMGLGLDDFEFIDEDSLEFPSKENGFFKLVVDDSGKERQIPQTNELARYFKDRKHFLYDDDYCLVYKDDYYQRISTTGVRASVEDLTQGKCSSRLLSEFLDKIKTICYKPRAELSPPDGLINLKNGALSVRDRQLLGHSANNFFTYKLNHGYDPDATCPVFSKYLESVFDGDEDLIKLVAQALGYTLMGGPPSIERAFVLVGSGRNGKSTLLNTTKKLLGMENCSSVSLRDIDKPFSTVMFDGKLANIVEEAPNTIDAEAFKNLVGGGTVVAAHKNKPQYDLRVFARFFFACNKLPNFKETSPAIRDRLVFIPFDRYLPENERDIRIEDKISKEMSGILNFAIRGLESFLSEGLINPKASQRKLQEYIMESDSCEAWFDEVCYIDAANEAGSLVNSAKESYRIYCQEQDRRPVGQSEFSARVTSILFKRIGKDKGWRSPADAKYQERSRKTAYRDKFFFKCLGLKSYF